MEIQPEFKPQAATLIVAASDSLHPERADYYCNGTDDDVQIQAAIDALPTIGGEVYTLEGTYVLGTGVISVTKNFVYLNFHNAQMTYSGTGHCIEAGKEPGGSSLRGFRCDIGKLTAIGNAVSSATAVGIYLRHVSFGAEIWANIRNFETGVGVQLDSQASPIAYCGLIFFRKLMLASCKYGVKSTGDESIHACEFEQLWWSSSCNDGKGIFDATTSANHMNRIKYGTVYIENSIYTGCIGIDVQGKNHLIDLMIQDGSLTNSIKSTKPFTILDCNSSALAILDVPQGSLVISEGLIYLGYGSMDLQYNSQTNLLKNSSFEIENPPTDWDTAYATILQENTIVKIDDYSLKITADDAVGLGWGFANQRISNPIRYRGRDVTLGAWVQAASGNDKIQLLRIEDSGGYSASDVIPHDDDWHWVTVTRTIDNSTTFVDAAFVVKYTAADTDDILYVDGAILVEGSICPAFSPQPATADERNSGAIIHTDLLMDVLAVSATHVRSNEDLSVATPITFTLTAQPDVPRTLSWSFDTHAQITEYDMEVIGVDTKGNTVTETWDETAGWSGETSNAFATITSIKMTSRTGTGVADTMDIGITDVLGLSNIIYETSDVFKIKKNNANVTVATAQVNIIYGTYDMSVITLGVGDDFTIWYKSNLNIIS